jgi:hypothetical protein
MKAMMSLLIATAISAKVSPKEIAKLVGHRSTKEFALDLYNELDKLIKK